MMLGSLYNHTTAITQNISFNLIGLTAMDTSVFTFFRMLRSLCLSSIVLAFAISIQSSSRTFAARVLISVFQQPSHVLYKQNIAVDLIRRGHDVYFALASGYPKTEPLRRVGINVLLYQQQPNVIYPFSPENEALVANEIFNRTQDLAELSRIVNDDCETILQDTEYLKKLRAMNFDIAIVEPFIANPCHMIISQYLGIPFVCSTRAVVPFSFRLPALPSFYAIVRPGPEIRDLPRLDSIYGRLMNAVTFSFFHFALLPQLWGNTTLLEKYTPEIESWEQLMTKSELLLLESDHYLDSSLPLLPHVINIAGCGARPSEPLPDELEKVMESSGENGVILASFGTSAYRMPGDIAKKFLDAFGRLKETVLTRMAVPRDVKVSMKLNVDLFDGLEASKSMS